MLTSIAWVPKGAMKAMPIFSSDSAEEARKKLHSQNPDVPDEKQEEHGQQGHTRRSSDSDDDVVVTGRQRIVDDTLRDIAGAGAGTVMEEIASEDEDEMEDVCFKETDLVFSVTVADTTTPRMELYTYDEPNDVLFVHHDTEISALPLCSAWLTDGNMSMLAIGTMKPCIEIWALDVVDSVEPALVLGGCARRTLNYSKKNMRQNLVSGSHTDGVLALSWNTVAQNIIASGSADHTIKLWDLNHAATSTAESVTACLGTYHEEQKIQSLDWHSEEGNLLLSGGFDSTVVLRDCRASQQAALRYSFSSVIEHVEFVPHQQQIMVSCQDGTWASYEMRMNVAEPLWSKDQTNGGETTFTCSRHVPGLYATGGKDGSITLWDGRSTLSADSKSSAPRVIVSRDYKTGSIFGLAFHPNSPHILGACGARGEPLVYTMTDDLAQIYT